MREKRNLEHLFGAHAGDDGLGELHNLGHVIDELQEFVGQFSTHAMSDEALRLMGQKEAYQDVIQYLKRVKGG